VRRTIQLGLAAMTVGVMLLAAAPAGADHVDPVDFAAKDNPSCADVSAAYVNEFKINSAPANQVYPVSAADSGVQGGGTITISNAGVVNGVYEFDWASSIGWDAVIVKQGDGATVYTYVTDSTGDTDLHPSLTNGQPTGGISHVTFCRDNGTTTTTTSSTTSTTQGTTTSTASVLGVVVTPTTAAPAAQVLGVQVLPATGATTGLLTTVGAALVLLGGTTLLVGARKARLG
jgi:hypothetical protein